MAVLAVHGNHVLSVGGGHLVVVTPPTTREVIVPDVVGVGLPIGVHLGERDPCEDP